MPRRGATTVLVPTFVSAGNDSLQWSRRHKRSRLLVGRNTYATQKRNFPHFRYRHFYFRAERFQEGAYAARAVLRRRPGAAQDERPEAAGQDRDAHPQGGRETRRDRARRSSTDGPASHPERDLSPGDQDGGPSRADAFIRRTAAGHPLHDPQD